MDFESLLETVKENTILADFELNLIFKKLNECLSLEGDCSELGVYKGGSALLMSEIINGTDKKIYAFDTFSGLQNCTEEDKHNNNDFNDTEYKSVKKLLMKNKNVIIKRGLFPDTTKDLEDDLKFCFCHFDADTYQSCNDFLNYFYPLLVINGIMIFHDYGWIMCPGVKKSIDNFVDLNKNNIIAEKSQISTQFIIKKIS